MDVKKVGRAIAYLRKRAGYTQKELAGLIGISDKAVSKWERGLGLPDVAYISRLAALLDTDVEGILAGNVIHEEKGWNGLLVLPSNPCSIGPSTLIYDKPMVYFLLSYFLLVGIRKIAVVGSRRDRNYITSEFGDGSKIGIELCCLDNLDEVNASLACSNVMVVFGYSLIYGVGMTRFFQRAMNDRSHATILSVPKKVESGELTLYFDHNKRVINAETFDRKPTTYDYAQIPILFCPKAMLGMVLVSEKTTGGLSIDLSDPLLRKKFLYTDFSDRGYIEFSIDSLDALLGASNFVRIVQESSGFVIYCIEEIAWRRGMISLSVLKELGCRKAGTEYGKYILSLVQETALYAGTGM